MEYFPYGAYAAEHKSEESDNNFADIISLTSNTFMPDMRTSPVTASPASPRPSASGEPPISPIIEGPVNPPEEPLAFVGEFSNSASIKLNDNVSKNSFFGEGHDCKKCSETFPTPVALRQHILTHYRTGPLYQCNVCPFQSVNKSTLKRHIRRHNREHPFKCSICDNVFTTKASGHRHVKSKHKLSEQEEADAVVYNPRMLETNNSDRVFSESTNSETVCKYCKIDFMYNRILIHHIRSLNHSCSRKPYSCAMCKQGFSTKSSCIRHITNHHAESKNKAKVLVVVNELTNSGQQDPSPTESEETNEGESVNTEAQSLTLSRCSGNEESSHTMEHDDLELIDSDAGIAVAQTLVSLSESIPPQEKPLDLTLCALNLTLKDCNGQN